MRWPVRVALTAGSGTWLLALAAAAAYVATRHGFGSGDLAAFAFWTAFLGALMAALAAPVLRRTARRGRVARTALAALAGLAAGLAFTMAVAFALGPMVLAFSFPILPIWMGASAVALAGTALLAPAPADAVVAGPARLGRAIAIVAIMLVGVIALPILLLVAQLVFNRAEREIHLIPAGYEGPVVVIFGDSAGSAERREGRARVYEIPASGVLRTHFAANDGVYSSNTHHYFYVDAAGRRTPIRWGGACRDSLPATAVRVCDMPLVMTMSSADRPQPPAYTSYLVGPLGHHEELQARWDSVVRTEVLDASEGDTPRG